MAIFFLKREGGTLPLPLPTSQTLLIKHKMADKRERMEIAGLDMAVFLFTLPLFIY